MPRTPPSRPALGLLACLGLTLAVGCENYAEAVGCGMGLVLDDTDRCVAPPRPDGGVGIATCAELCEQVPTWTEERRMCLEDQLAMFGSLPPACQDVTTAAECLACLAETGAPDSTCASVPALCP